MSTTAPVNDQSTEANFLQVPPQEGFQSLAKARPNTYHNFFAMAEDIMRADGALSAAEREIVGAYVSKISDCNYCYQSHIAIAEALGADQAVNALDNPTQKMTVLLELADKIVKHVAPITRTDIDAVIAQGWPEAAAEEVIHVAAFFGFANRIVTGYGFVGTEASFAQAGKFLAKSYLG